MAMEYLGLSDINGPLVAVDGVKGVGFEEMVEMKTATGTRLGRIAALEGERAVIQVFAGTSGMTLSGTASRFTGSPMRLALAFSTARANPSTASALFTPSTSRISTAAPSTLSPAVIRATTSARVFLPSTALLR